MRDVAVTFPTRLVCSVIKRGVCHSTRFYELLVKLRMATHAIVVNNVLTLRDGFHGHRLIAHSEYIGVAQSVFRLEEVLVENVVVRYVTVVAGCHILV